MVEQSAWSQELVGRNQSLNVSEIRLIIGSKITSIDDALLYLVATEWLRQKGISLSSTELFLCECCELIIDDPESQERFISCLEHQTS